MRHGRGWAWRFRHQLLRDSKQLTPQQRETVEPVIREAALELAVVEITADQINHRGLGWANKEVFRRLALMIEADGYCCDGRLNIESSRKIHSLVGGDALIPAISAASIVAKVHRDALMRELHGGAPDYNWHSNKGYGVPLHREAIMRVGTHAQHRNVFIASMLQGELDLIASEN